jgi:hypothetical protein
VGGDWPTKAREAALVLSGEEVSAFNVDLLGDIKKAFGDLDCIASADLVAELVADPERPWATCGRNDKALTQNHLARLLRPFCIASETVHPIGQPHAKGYKRAHFEEAWEVYLAGQNPRAQQIPDSEACKRASADETGTTRNFQSVQELNPHASKSDDLANSHAGLHACTVGKAKNGARGDSATNGGGVPNDFDAVLEELATRPTHRPPPGHGWQLAGTPGAGAVIWIRSRTPPALGPPGDDVYDIDPAWRQ